MKIEEFDGEEDLMVDSFSTSVVDPNENARVEVESIILKHPELTEFVQNFSTHANKNKIKPDWVSFLPKLKAELEKLTQPTTEIEVPHYFDIETDEEPNEQTAEDPIPEVNAEIDKRPVSDCSIVPAWTPPPVERTDKHEFMDLPSNYLFYNEIATPEMYCRTFKAKDLRMITTASKIGFQVFIEYISNLMTINPYYLTQGDFYYIMHWLRAKSFPKTPISIKWRSRYGVTQTSMVTMSKLKETRLTKDHQEIYEQLQALGGDMPRMYDVVAAENISLPENHELTWSFLRSQYLKPLPNETVLERIERFEDLDTATIEEIELLVNKLNHGVAESMVTSIDKENFQVDSALAELKSRVKDLETIRDESPVWNGELQEYLDDYSSEILDIENKLEDGGDIEPRAETIRAQINIDSFLSNI